MAKNKYQHVEAFCLMLYRDTAGNEEWIWNSRDGVTPFCINSRQGLEAKHVEWSRDRCVPNHKPKPGDRIFVDLTLDAARAYRKKFVEVWWDKEVYGSTMSQRYASKEEAVELLAKSDMEHGGGGAPDLIEVIDQATKVN